MKKMLVAFYYTNGIIREKYHIFLKNQCAFYLKKIKIIVQSNYFSPEIHKKH